MRRFEFEEKAQGFFKADTNQDTYVGRGGLSVSDDRISCYQLLRDWLNIYTWKETWIPVGAAVFVVSLWWYLCLTFMVLYPFGAVMFWSVFLALVTGAVAVNPEGRC